MYEIGRSQEWLPRPVDKARAIVSRFRVGRIRVMVASLSAMMSRQNSAYRWQKFFSMSRLDKLQDLLVVDPTDSFTRYAIGLEFAKAENFVEAIRVLEDLRERDPEYVPTYYMLAGYYRFTGDTDSAKLIYREGMAMAKKANDRHALSELESALDEIE